MRGYALVYDVRLVSVGESNVYVCEFKPKARVDVRGDFLICFNNVLDIDIDKVVERVDVLLYETLYFEESWQEKPFVLQSWVKSVCP